MGLFNMSPDQQPLNYQVPRELTQPQPAPQQQQAPDHIKPSVWGILADALSGAAGQPGQYGAGLREQLQAQREGAARAAQAQQQQAAEYAQFVQREQYKAANPEESPISRDTNAYIGMDPAHQDAYRSMHPGQLVNMTLPNGQFYSGPADGVAAALTGGQSGGLPKAHELIPMGGASGNVGGTFQR